MADALNARLAATPTGQADDDRVQCRWSMNGREMAVPQDLARLEARLEEAKWRLNHWPPLGALQSPDFLRCWIFDRQSEQEARIAALDAELTLLRAQQGITTTKQEKETK